MQDTILRKNIENIRVVAVLAGLKMEGVLKRRGLKSQGS